MKTLQLVVFMTLTTMNVSYSQSIVNVWGSDDPLTVAAQIEQSLHHLGIHEFVRLDIIFTENLPKNFDGITLAYDLPNTDKKYYRVRIKAQLNPIKYRFVLAHEMIHVKQFAKKELKIVDQKRALWKGKTYNIKGLNHRQLPWEQDAARQDGQLAKLFEKHISTSLTVSKNQ